MAGDRSVTADSTATIRKIATVAASTSDFLPSLITAERISATTAARTPSNAHCTISMC
jgi:hypothetical protein